MRAMQWGGVMGVCEGMSKGCGVRVGLGFAFCVWGSGRLHGARHDSNLANEDSERCTQLILELSIAEIGREALAA